MDSELHAVRLAPMIHTKLRTNERRNSRTLKKKRVPALQGGRVSYRGTDERLEVASVDGLDTDARNNPVQRRRVRRTRVARRKPVEVARNKPAAAERRTPFAVRARCRQRLRRQIQATLHQRQSRCPHGLSR